MERLSLIDELIEFYKKLPGIGSKTAERLSYATLNMTDEERERFSSTLLKVNSSIKRCPDCGMYFENRCPICSDEKRNKDTLLVVADSKDILSIEKTGGYKGQYFSLNGTLSPLKNRMPEDIGINKLKEKVKRDSIKEVILALPTTLEGETTALYIANIYKDEDVIVSKIANGIPIGTNLEYLDGLTIKSSIVGRVNISKER